MTAPAPKLRWLWGMPVWLLRWATVDDVTRYRRRPANALERAQVERRAWVLVYDRYGQEMLAWVDDLYAVASQQIEEQPVILPTGGGPC